MGPYIALSFYSHDLIKNTSTGHLFAGRGWSTWQYRLSQQSGLLQASFVQATCNKVNHVWLLLKYSDRRKPTYFSPANLIRAELCLVEANQSQRRGSQTFFSKLTYCYGSRFAWSVQYQLTLNYCKASFPVSGTYTEAVKDSLFNNKFFGKAWCDQDERIWIQGVTHHGDKKRLRTTLRCVKLRFRLFLGQCVPWTLTGKVTKILSKKMFYR